MPHAIASVRIRGSLRKAIDGALAAYKIILEPNSATAYIDDTDPHHRDFEYIKSHIKEERQKNSAKYPLAGPLLEAHEAFSAFGSHADIDSFFHRLEVRRESEGAQDEVFVHYFQFPKKKEEYQFYFVVTLLDFWHIFRIFKVFFDAKLKIVDPDWERAIEALGPRLVQLKDKYYRAFTRP